MKQREWSSRRSLTADDTEKNIDYYLGNTWQFWIGPKVSGDDANAKEINAAVERVFQSANKVKECVDRHRRALVGKTPAWTLSDGKKERSAAVAKAELELQTILDYLATLSNGQECDIGDPLSQAVQSMLLTGYGYLRLWCPERYKNASKQYQRVAMHSPEPGSVEIDRDRDGFINEIRYTYGHCPDEDDPQEYDWIEVQRIDPVTEMTVFQTIDVAGAAVVGEDGRDFFELDLGGRYTIYEMRREPFITPSIKQAQNAINFALTLIPRNLEYAGFLRELISNAQPPGRWESDKETGERKFIPDEQGIITGPGITTFLNGIPIYDDAGNVASYATPSVQHRQPVEIRTFAETLRTAVQVIYEETGQAHMLAADSTLSGVSRVQLRQDFETALAEDATTVAAAISGIYGSALMMTQQESPEAYRDLAVVAKCRLSVSKPTPEEQEQLLKFNGAALLSKATAITQSGFVDDTDAEMALIKEEIQEMQAMQIVEERGAAL